MKFKGYKVYNDEEFLKKYLEKRDKGNSPNELIEKPIIEELLGELFGKQLLDLGCGDGRYGKELLIKGVAKYIGVEGSKRMSDLAKKNLEGFDYEILNKDLIEIELTKEAYDIVLSRLVFHYIEDLDKIFRKIHKSIKRDGVFVFSVEHPIITSNYESYHKEVKRGNWIVDNYFSMGERVNKWIDKEVIKYHKTIEEYWSLIKKSGFEILEIKESKPRKSNFEDESEYDRRKRIPLFMIFKLKKIK